MQQATQQTMRIISGGILTKLGWGLALLWAGLVVWMGMVVFANPLKKSTPPPDMLARLIGNPLLLGYGLIVIIATAAAIYLYYWITQQQAEHGGEQIKELLCYSVTLGEGGKVDGGRMAEFYASLHGVMESRARQRLIGEAQFIRLSFIGNLGAGKCLYVELPRSDEALISAVRAALQGLDPSNTLQVRLVEGGQLPIAVKGRADLRTVWQGAKLARPSHYPIKTDFAKGYSPVSLLAQLLDVSETLPLVGVTITIRAAGGDWVQQGTAENMKAKRQQAAVPAGQRERGVQKEQSYIEGKRIDSDGLGYETRIVAYAAAPEETRAKQQVKAVISTWLGQYRGSNRFVAELVGGSGDLAGLQAKLSSGPVWGLGESGVLSPSEISALAPVPSYRIVPGWLVSGSINLPPGPDMVVGTAPVPKGETPKFVRRLRQPIKGMKAWEQGVVEGGYYNQQNGHMSILGIPNEDRRQHGYVIGKSGSGKTTFMANLFLGDIAAGTGAMYLEPHGDNRKILLRIPRRLEHKVVYINPTEQYLRGRTATLNVMACSSGAMATQVMSQMMQVFETIAGANFANAPRMKIVMLSVLRVLIATMSMSADTQPTIKEFYNFLAKPEYRAEIMERAPLGDLATDYWSAFAELDDKKQEEVLGPAKTRLYSLLLNDAVAGILTYPQSTFDLGQLMNKRKIILMTLLKAGKEGTGDPAMSMLGMLFIMRLRLEAMGRESVLEEERIPFNLYIDEFQNFTTLDIEAAFAEVRKYALHLMVGNQNIGQLPRSMLDAVVGNTVTQVSFNLSPNDRRYVADTVFGRQIRDNDLRLNRSYCYVQTQVRGNPQPLCLMQTPDWPPVQADSYAPARLEDGMNWVEQQGLRLGTRPGDLCLAKWLDKNPGAVADKLERIAMLSDLQFTIPRELLQGGRTARNSVVDDETEREMELAAAEATSGVRRGLERG